MLRHRSMDMTLRQAKIANRTVADEYIAVTDIKFRPTLQAQHDHAAAQGHPAGRPVRPAPQQPE